MKSKQKTRIERRIEWERQRCQECQCRACTALKYEHSDVHLRKNQPSPWCYKCRKDFTKEEVDQALSTAITAVEGLGDNK